MRRAGTCLLISWLSIAASVPADTLATSEAAVGKYFDLPAESRALADVDWGSLGDLSETEVGALRDAIMNAAKREAVRLGWPEEMEQRIVKFEHPKLGAEPQELKYFVCETKGEKPENGWPLFINLHGGGAAEQECKIHQKRYAFYEGKFIVPRDDHVKIGRWKEPHFTPIFKLMTQMVLFEDVDPNRIYLMGFSEGGNGCFRMSQNRLDRFAGLGPSSASGGPPAEHFLNTALIHQWGRGDKNYDRNAYASAFKDRMWALKARYPDRLPFKLIQHQKDGHHISDHREPFSPPLWLAPHVRDPVPTLLLWNTRRVPNWFWLRIEDHTRSLLLSASYSGNTVTLESPACTVPITVRLDDRMMDLDEPVTITMNGITLFHGRARRRPETMVKTWEESRDPGLVFSAEVTVTNDLSKDPRHVENLALGRPTQASGSSEKGGPELAVDGSTAEGWTAPNHDPYHWWSVDLGGPATLTGCAIVWRRPYLYQYKVEGRSGPESKWVMLVDRTENGLRRQEARHGFEAKGIAEVRITATGIGVGLMSLREVHVYGKQ